MKKQFVIASSLITQMSHLGQAVAQNTPPELHEQLTNYMKEEAQKPASPQSSKAYHSRTTGGLVIIKKLRSPFRHIAKRADLAVKNNFAKYVSSSSGTRGGGHVTSSSDVGGNDTTSSSGVVDTSSSARPLPPSVSVAPTLNTAPRVPTSSSDVAPSAGPTSSSGEFQGTSSSSQPTNPPPTASSARCSAPFKPISSIKTYSFQVTLASAQGVQMPQSAPYYFANKIRESAQTVVYQVFQFDHLSDLAHPKATAYLVVNNETQAVTFSNWTPLK